VNRAVLLVDTDTSFVKMISALLEFNDFSVIRLDESENLANVLDNQPVSVVLADIMAGMSIEELMESIADKREISMILTGIRDLSNTERKKLLSRSIPFIKKPCMPSLVCDKIKKIVR
jgi:response regulator RpfG family c-di-GMP phosphodiesterase